MQNMPYRIVDRKVILYTRGKICENADELLSSELFRDLLRRFVDGLEAKHSPLIDIFGGKSAAEGCAETMADTLYYLAKLPARQVPNVVVGADAFFRDIPLLGQFVEQLYNYWRSFERFIICDSAGDRLDQRPYRTFNETIEKLTHLVRGVYRDIAENISADHPRIYRQVPAGAEIAAISLPHEIPFDGDAYDRLKGIPVIRQVLINPPLILNPPMNTRAGQFVKIDRNPLELVDFKNGEWLCYPAKVGPLLILVYFHQRFFELGFSLCNLFEMAGDDELARKPDAVFAYGVPGNALDSIGAAYPTVFHEDEAGGMLVAAVPGRDEFGYFGYIKKMILTLHNVKMMRAGKLPFHGAFVRILLDNGVGKNALLIGDTGAGKSEMLESLRVIGNDVIRDIAIIADDMGSIDIDHNGVILGYGTETGAFLRLDDLQPGYAFGQIDRSIIMSPAKVNARIVIPVTSYDTIMKGHRIDMVLYANNYEQVDEEHPLIERIPDAERAISVFREGTVMSKGTTNSTGIVHSYFANIFGPPQYRELHDRLALVFFNAFFNGGIFVGQIRTRLGIHGYESEGPAAAARALLDLLRGEKPHAR